MQTTRMMSIWDENPPNPTQPLFQQLGKNLSAGTHISDFAGEKGFECSSTGTENCDLDLKKGLRECAHSRPSVLFSIQANYLSAGCTHF